MRKKSANLIGCPIPAHSAMLGRLDDMLTLLDLDYVVELDEDPDELVAADASPILSLGVARLTLARGSLSYDARVYFLDKAIQPLLSKHGCIQLGLLPRDWPNTLAQLSL